ncbi:zinc finger protein JACKDAW-like [Dorcoceras hygrometricum]|uniref:Zinc finger protein JACKDAW-like n=1 Tax=Dorcoceras hygrometricum TaxID=472368 RepID=A0A2Z7CLT9_9LAMI|nr:zinc finger protein JACKDAW-like [Dorcoceras hygrometricum]
MQFVKIKRLGLGKFYLSHKGDHAFIKGNPSSHKGWMSRFFFVKRAVRKRELWKCDMSWRDNINTLTPRTPDRSPNLASFLEVMRDKSYSAPALIREDLLCAFGFSKRGVELVGTSETRHEKRAKKKAASTSGSRREETPKTTMEPTPPKNVSEEAPDQPPVITITGDSPSGRGSERVPPFDPSKDSLVASPSTVMATRYICNMAPVRDLQVLAGAGDVEAVGHFAANIASVRSRSSELQLSPYANAANINPLSLCRPLLGGHAEVVVRLEELEALRAREEREAKAQVEALELNVEKEARRAEKEAREALEAELQTGCLAQFRANGYPEEEHPASFLDVQQALAEMGDDEEEVEEEEPEEQEEGEIGSDAGDNPPPS